MNIAFAVVELAVLFAVASAVFVIAGAIVGAF